MEMIGKKEFKKNQTKSNQLLKKNKGKLIEIPYTKNISSSSIKSDLINHLTPTSRVSILKRLIDSKKIVRILESHSPLSGLIAENMKFQRGNKKSNLMECGHLA